MPHQCSLTARGRYVPSGDKKTVRYCRLLDAEDGEVSQLLVVGGRALHYRIGAENQMAERRFADEARLPAILDHMPRSAPYEGSIRAPTLDFDTSLFLEDAYEEGRDAPWATSVEDQDYLRSKGDNERTRCSVRRLSKAGYMPRI